MITIDFETKSEADLKKVGAQMYSLHPSTEVICACWGIDDEPIVEWWPDKSDGVSDIEDLSYAVSVDGHEVEAHNVAFEYFIWKNVCETKYGWDFRPKWDKWRDTMAVACYYAMPAELDKLARALGFPGKDPEGGRLITKYSKLHLKTAKREIPEEDFRKFVAYCKRDVELEQAVSDYLGDLPDREMPLFLLDQKMNRRGLYLDAEGIACAQAVVDARAEELIDEFVEITTNPEHPKGLQPTQRDKVLHWFHDRGLALENLRAEHMEEALEEWDIPQGPARRALEIRVRVNKASTKKLDAMARQRGPDGCARYQTRYHGALTGRNTGGGFQPLNMTRGFDYQGSEADKNAQAEMLAQNIMRWRDPAWLDMLYGDAMYAVAKASRHWIVAKPDHKLIAGDYVSVEAVVLACVAGEEWKVKAFAEGVKIYELMADKIYNLPPGTVTKKTHPSERQDGKTCLGAGTRVLTTNGIKPIIDVSLHDKLWDGEEWVEHQGLLSQGEKITINVAGAQMTPDHKILARQGWVEALQAVLSESMLTQALEIGSENLPWPVTNGGRKGVSWLSGYGAHAAPENIWSRKRTFATAERRAVQIALKKLLDSGVNPFLGTPTSALTKATDGGCSTASLPALRGASQTGTGTTEDAALKSGRNGGEELRGVEAFFGTYLLLRAGISQLWKLIASTLTRDTSRGICDLQSEGRVRSVLSKSCKQELMSLRPVYDLANAGSRKRFTIITDYGPMLVHNCELAFGYQGALNAWLKFDSSGRHSDARIIEICKAWRAEHPAIVAFWRGLEEAALDAVRRPGVETGYREIGFEVVDEWLTMILPDGKRLWYFDPQLRMTMPQWHQPAVKERCRDGTCDCTPRAQVTYRAWKNKQFKRVSTYGGKLTENAVQAISRQIMGPASLALEARQYPVILTVYDEIVCQPAINFGSPKEFEEIAMAATPKFARSWPLRMEAWQGHRYRK